MKTRTLIVFPLLLVSVLAMGAGRRSAAPAAPVNRAKRAERAELAEQVRREFIHSWQAYERYAWGHDELKPLSKAPHDWYGTSLQITPVDTLETLLLMGLNEEAARTKNLIVEKLSFDQDVEVKNFEITIRLDRPT